MKINSAPAYVIEDKQISLERRKVVIHNTGHHMRMLSESTYNFPIPAVVRETIANAMDASKGAKFDVSMPSALDPNFRVRDYGVGMDEEFFLNGYAQVGFSTKRDSNDEIGGFGQGRFAAFAYKPCDTFFVRGIKDRKMFLGQVQRDANFEIFVDVIQRADTIESNGVEVFVPVNTADFSAFAEAIGTYTEFLSPRPDGLPEPPTRPAILEAADGSWKISKFTSSSYDNNEEYGVPVRAIMGGIPYKLNLQTVFGYSNDDYLNIAVADIHFPIGSLSVPNSREELRYDDATKLAVRSKFKAMRAEIEKLSTDVQLTLTTDWERWTHPAVLGYNRALGQARGTFKRIKKQDVPDLLLMHNLNKLREAQGRSRTIVNEIKIDAGETYLIYLINDTKFWRRKIEIDSVAKANVQIKLGNGNMSHPHGSIIVVGSQAGIDALGNPPYVKVSGLPRPPVVPRPKITVNTVVVKRLPTLYVSDGGSWKEDTTPDWTKADVVYWPFKISKMTDEYRWLWESTRHIEAFRTLPGLPELDLPVVKALSWKPVDQWLKEQCQKKDVIEGYHLYCNSAETRGYYGQTGLSGKMQELYWLLKHGFKLPQRYSKLVRMLTLVGDLCWNTDETKNFYPLYITHEKLIEPVKGKPEHMIVPEMQTMLTNHPFFTLCLEQRMFTNNHNSSFKGKLKIATPDLLSFARKAL